MKAPAYKSFDLPDGTPMRCIVCSHDRFQERTLWIRDRTPGPLLATLFDSSGRPIQAAVCEKCGYVHLFLRD